MFHFTFMICGIGITIITFLVQNTSNKIVCDIYVYITVCIKLTCGLLPGLYSCISYITYLYECVMKFKKKNEPSIVKYNILDF